MTIIEMHALCDLLLDKADSPWFTSEEKDKFINLGQEEFVQTQYEQFEFNEKARKNLLPLVRSSSGTNTSTINLDAIPMYMYTLGLSGNFNSPCGGNVTRKISPLQIDDEAETEQDPFNKSADDNPNYVEENNGTNNVCLIKSDTVPVSYTLKYLKQPRKVKNDETTPANNVNSEMPDFTHEDIVYIAVNKMLANTEQFQNYQVNKVENIE